MGILLVIAVVLNSLVCHIRSEEMVNAYLKEIALHIGKVQAQQDILEAQVTDGCKDVKVLEPLILELSKSIENYNDNMKAIRQAYVPCNCI